MTESSSVQGPMIRYAREIGWVRVNRREALRRRGGPRGLFFTDVLKDGLLRLNPDVVNESRVQEIVRQMNLIRPSLEGNREALSWLKGNRSVFVPEENRERNVSLIDFEDPDNNLFQVTDEWRQQGAASHNRADVVFLVNGVPIVVVETKSAEKDNGLAEGLEQIRRYHRETPEMFTTAQLFGVTQLLDFRYGATWSTDWKSLFQWKIDAPKDYEQKVKTFFDQDNLLSLLKDYILFLTKDDELKKIVLRQHQTRAVEKVLDRIFDPKKRRGLVWHTQGSGKTLTMITIASKMLLDFGKDEAGVREPTGDGRDLNEDEKPTILMLIDRNELEGQLTKNIEGYGIGEFEVAKSKLALQNVIASDQRGLLVSMIHKFEGIPAKVNERSNLTVLVDEAHRTTSGDLGNYLMAALPNANYIGFTGTPIDNISHGKGTFKVFGIDDDKGYLDKYSIAESIQDGTTVQLNYSLAPSELLVDKETLEREFLDLAEAQGISDPEELNALLDRAVKLKELMKSPQRMEKIASFVAKHFQEVVEPMGFKAFLVGVDREACALYKKELDRYLPPEWSEVVYSPHHKDRENLKEYYLSPDEEKDIRKNFTKKNRLPKILIVTQKLLTGYDAPILYCMYLDKPMRDHVLLQAIARVNRPYEDEDGLTKPSGLVVDFVGIFDKLEKALAFDSDVVASTIQNIDVLKNLFEHLMKETASPYLELAKGWDDKSKERAVEKLKKKEKRQEFFRFFEQIQNLYEILSPDAFLRPYIRDYQSLARLYALLRNAYNNVQVDEELKNKTKEILQRNAEGGPIALPGAIHKLGPEELAKLKRSGLSDRTKILNLNKALNTLADRESKSKPFLIPIGERAQALAQTYEDHQRSTQQALAEFENLAQECILAEEERREMDLDENCFAIYKALKPHIDNLTKEQAEGLNGLIEAHPDYLWNDQEERELRAKLYKLIIPLTGPEKMTELTDKLLELQRV